MFFPTGSFMMMTKVHHNSETTDDALQGGKSQVCSISEVIIPVLPNQ
jgi:hypothetical protein